MRILFGGLCAILVAAAMPQPARRSGTVEIDPGRETGRMNDSSRAVVALARTELASLLTIYPELELVSTFQDAEGLIIAMAMTACTRTRRFNRFAKREG